jgi:hypothetical protein
MRNHRTLAPPHIAPRKSSIAIPFVCTVLCAVFTALPAAAAQAVAPKPVQVTVASGSKAAPKLNIKAGTAAKPVSKPDAPLLPSTFSGWDSNVAKAVIDPVQVDAANAAALKEYGFTDAVLRDYTRDSDTLHIKALRFTDASGAYGAYSFYRHSSWPKEQIGTGAASDHNRVLFWIGDVFVDATFTHISAMSGSELRDLAAQIPVPTGNKLLPPPILGNLPQKDMDGQTTHYALGPVGYVGPVGTAAAQDPVGVLPPGLVGFDRGAETATATYKLRSGPATLTVINYPTPQMAAAMEKTIAAYIKAGNSPTHPFSKALQDSNPASLEVKRSGPLVTVVSGDAIQDEAHKLLASVHYEANTANVPQQLDSEVKKTAQLLLSIVTLVIIMFIAAVMLALFLGGGRALYRIARGRPASSLHDQEFTRLDLRD